MQSDYLFVYGTLCQFTRSKAHENLCHGAQFISEAFIYGRLYEIAAYPGVLQTDQYLETVHGELYRLTNTKEILEALDEYEECSANFERPHEYSRELIDVYISAGESLTAWCYLLNEPKPHYIRIPSGRYQNSCLEQQIFHC